MRFIVGKTATDSGVFVVQGDTAKKISGADTDLMPLIDMTLSGAGGLTMTYGQMDGPEVLVSDITPALPVANPGKIICLGLNYIDHIKEGGYEIPTYPALFMRARNSIMPAGAPMVRPTCSEMVLSRLRSGLSTHLCGLSLKCQGAFAA